MFFSLGVFSLFLTRNYLSYLSYLGDPKTPETARLSGFLLGEKLRFTGRKTTIEQVDNLFKYSLLGQILRYWDTEQMEHVPIRRDRY